MAGQRIPLFTKRTFDFGGVQANQSVTITLAKAIDARKFVEGLLSVRVHSASVNSGANVTVELLNAAPSPEEPGVEFFESKALAEVAVVDTTSPPALLTIALGDAELGFIRLSVVGKRSASGGDAKAELSADLVLKE